MSPLPGTRIPHLELGGMPNKRVLLLQARDWDDPMRPHEVDCFRERIPSCYALETSNLTQGPWEASLLKGYQAVMVGGSGGYGAADNRESWFEPSLALFREVVKAELPLFCSCWGHEALAVALGGRGIVEKKGYELGLLPVKLSQQGKDDSLFGTLPDPFVTPIGHEEQVTVLPNDAVLLDPIDPHTDDEASPDKRRLIADRPTVWPGNRSTPPNSIRNSAAPVSGSVSRPTSPISEISTKASTKPAPTASSKLFSSSILRVFLGSFRWAHYDEAVSNIDSRRPTRGTHLTEKTYLFLSYRDTPSRWSEERFPQDL